MRILFVQPAEYEPDGKTLRKFKKVWFAAVTLPYLAALVPPEHEVAILDENVQTLPETVEADVVGITAMGANMERAFDLGDRFLRQGKTVLLGGPTVTVASAEAARHCTTVVKGECEETLGQILADAARGALEPVYEAPRFPDLSTLPHPRYELMDPALYEGMYPIQIGRGCPHHCEFCGIDAMYGGTCRIRPVDDVIEDVRIVKALGAKYVFFVDDNPIYTRAFAMEFFRKLVPFQVQWASQISIQVVRDEELLDLLIESGCMGMSFGIESINPEALAGIGKRFNRAETYEVCFRRLREKRIFYSTQMMFGFDQDRPEDFERTTEFIIEQGIPVPMFHILTPIPGTPLYARLDKEGRIFDRDISRYTAARAVFHPRNMTAAELEDRYWSAYQRIYTYGAILRRLFRFGLRLAELKAFLVIFLINLYYRFCVNRRMRPGTY